jgi:hypothetical protein
VVEEAVMAAFTDQQEASAWFQLEASVAVWDRRYGERDISYGAAVYGGCLEPGYRLSSETAMSECPDCGRWRCRRHDWEQVDGGSLNFYYSLYCDACGLDEPELWNVN